MSRGNRRACLFWEESDRRRFLGLVSELPERFHLEVHAFVLMDNHYNGPHRLAASDGHEPRQRVPGGADGRDAVLNALVRDRGFAEPEDIAAAVLYLVSDEGRHVTGADLPVDDGFAIT